MVNIPLFTTGFSNIPGGFLARFLNHQQYPYGSKIFRYWYLVSKKIPFQTPKGTYPNGTPQIQIWKDFQTINKWLMAFLVCSFRGISWSFFWIVRCLILANHLDVPERKLGSMVSKWVTLPETNIAMENPAFWWYLPRKDGIFMGEVLVSGRVFHLLISGVFLGVT